MNETLCNHKQTSDALKNEQTMLNEKLNMLKGNCDELNSVLMSKTRELQLSSEALEVTVVPFASFFFLFSLMHAQENKPYLYTHANAHRMLIYFDCIFVLLNTI